MFLVVLRTKLVLQAEQLLEDEQLWQLLMLQEIHWLEAESM